MAFAELLSALLADRGKRQVDLVALLKNEGVDVTESAVSLWCSGKSSPTPDKLPGLMRALEVSAGERQQLLNAFMGEAA